MLTVLQVAYPLAPIGPDAVGGAEQMASALDRAVAAAGHRSIVVADARSRTAGELVPTPPCRAGLDGAPAAAHAAHRAAIAAVLARTRVDVVHLHGFDAHGYLPPPGVPALVTLHCPPEWHAPELLAPARPNTFLNAVSWHQHRRLPPHPAVLPPIETGVPVEAFAQARHARRRFALMLARLAPEKGVHLAIDAAKAAGVPLLIAGALYDYAAHRDYVAREVRPRLDARRRLIGAAGFARKRRLLAAARCLLVPSLAPETSSLVAREAIASGTPVIAFRAGALPETVDDGRTGFLVEDVAGMAAAIARTGEIDPDVCRATARARFSLEVMTARYLELYSRLAARREVAA